MQFNMRITMIALASRSVDTIVRRFQSQTQFKPLSRIINYGEVVPVFKKASNYTDRIALRDTFANYTYGNIFMGAKELSNDITLNVGRKNSERVVFLCPNDANYPICQWAIWISGQIAVPLSYLHPQTMLEYYVMDCNAKLLVCPKKYADLMQRVAKNTSKPLYVLDEKLCQGSARKFPSKKSDMEAGLSPDFYNRANAMILYTSGTTGNPKGVVLSHKNLVSQTTSLLDAWQWTNADTLLHCLPLHHVHGIVNALLCPLYIGAKCIMLPRFDSTTVWSHLLGINTRASEGKISVFMAVPTIYMKLIQEYERVFAGDTKMMEYIRHTLRTKLRLMVSGSAPLPTPIFDKWLEISGHSLLERYGMTEIGMCLSNPYVGKRKPGYVGLPLPGVSVRLVDPQDHIILEASNHEGKLSTNYTSNEEHLQGELQVKGDSIFREYFNRPEATAKDLSSDGWFKTGDIASFCVKDGIFKLLGRSNVDIIKTGGYKVSALEIETHLLAHPNILECAVLGVEDKEGVWGQQVVAVIVLRDPMVHLNLDSLRTWAKGKMAEYAVPKVLKLVPVIPRNVMGKINKKNLVKELFGE